MDMKNKDITALFQRAAGFFVCFFVGIFVCLFACWFLTATPMTWISGGRFFFIRIYFINSIFKLLLIEYDFNGRGEK